MSDDVSSESSEATLVTERAPGLALPQVQLKPRKARPFYGRHPWVLDSAIERIDPAAADGDAVDLLCDKGKWIARGLLNRASRIQVRLYTWSPAEPLDAAFWRQRLETAVQLRRDLGYDRPQGAARLVFSEADGLSGLVVDRYGEHVVVLVTALAMSKRVDEFVPSLVELLHPKSVLVRHDRQMLKSEGMAAEDRTVHGATPEGPVFIEENGLRFGVDLRGGQKTGFYLDQRENRRRAAEFCRGRRTLDLFCYTGGFSLAAIQAGARETLGVDTSERSVELAKANAALNGFANARFEAGDCFERLDALRGAREKFGAVILDPPKFASSGDNVEKALRAYHRLNRVAVDLLEPGGFLITCSCTGRVSREEFLDMLAGVAQQSKRQIQVLEQRGPAPDHPVSVSSLEGDYLKCVICRVV
ncbi:MAG: class I SAM-dependent rRNA methyltransferase [Pirellulales bacterium]